MNNVTLIGRLVRDPELRYTNTSNIPVASFTIAVKKFNYQTKEEEALFINCKVWREQAENLSKYQMKGDKIAVIGSIETETRDINGKNYSFQIVVADKIEYLEPKKESGKIEITQEQHEEPKKNVVDTVDDLPF